jgi:serine/threonine protein kinase
LFDELTRENVDGYVVGEIGRPAWSDARVRIVECGGHKAILKDVHDRHPLFRFTLGRRLISREYRKYKALDGVEGVPHVYRRLDRDAFLIEYVEGVPLALKYIGRDRKLTPELFETYGRLIDALHARGIVHLDLRNKKNFMLGPNDEAYIVDFASAIRVPDWLPFRGWFMKVLGSSDRTGLLKVKRRLAPDLMTDAERETLSRFETRRSIFLPHEWVRRLIRRRRRNRRAAKK